MGTSWFQSSFWISDDPLGICTVNDSHRVQDPQISRHEWRWIFDLFRNDCRDMGDHGRMVCIDFMDLFSTKKLMAGIYGMHTEQRVFNGF